MRKTIPLAIALTALALPALADSYPVDGRWGQSARSDKGAIDCSGKRVITFNGNQRQDSKGGVPAYRNKSVTAEGSSSYRVVDEFTTGQISNAQRQLHAAQSRRRPYRDAAAAGRNDQASALQVTISRQPHLSTSFTGR